MPIALLKKVLVRLVNAKFQIQNHTEIVFICYIYKLKSLSLSEYLNLFLAHISHFFNYLHKGKIYFLKFNSNMFFFSLYLRNFARALILLNAINYKLLIDSSS